MVAAVRVSRRDTLVAPSDLRVRFGATTGLLTRF
jgi:hypothetical protein